MATNAKIAGEEVMCPFCRDYRFILKVSAGYRVKCASCTYGRTFGAALFEAQRSADIHAKRYPLHVVGVLLGNRTVDVRRPKTIMVELPIEPPIRSITDVELPPF